MKPLRIFFVLAFVFILFSNFSPPVPSAPQKKFRLAYTTSEGSNAITPIDLQSGLAGSPIYLEHPPKSLAMHPNGSLAYILQDQSNEIIPVDLLTGKPRHSIVLETNPQRMVIVPKGGQSYVIYEGSHEINAIDVETGGSTPFMTLEAPPSRMTVAPDGKTLYVSYEGLKEITPIDIASATAQPAITLNDIPKGIVVTKDRLLAYLGENSPKKILFYNLEKEEFSESLDIEYEVDQIKKYIHDINIDPDGETAYLTEEDSQQIIPVNLKTPFVNRSITVDHRIKNLVIYPMAGGATSTTLISSAAPAVYGESITLTANVMSLVDNGNPTGTVTFVDTILGTLGTGTVDVNGNAAFTTTLPIGFYSLSANYGGDSNYNPSSSAPPYFIQDVNQALTTTAIASSANPSYFGNSVTFTATVTVESPGTGTPTGSVNFYDGVTLLGSGALTGTQATFSTSSLTPGSHSIKAVYQGDSNFVGSPSPTLTQTVNQGTTSTSVNSSLTPSPFGDSVTFTATITVTQGTGTPTGTVTFKDGSTTLSTQPLSAGTATFSTSTLAVGTHSIVAVYNGDTNFSTSTSPPFSQVISQGTTTTSVNSSVNPSTYGQQVTFSAQVLVATGIGTPTGNVTFKDGATTLGTSSLNGSGIATFSLANLSVNTHSITAVYNGDTNFSGSTSGPLSQVVNKATPQVTVTSSLSPSNYGDLVTFTATVTIINPPTTLGLPTGSVNFYDGLTLIGSGVLSASGTNTSKATFALSTLNAGTHPITAQYSGDTNFTALTSPIFSQVVNPVTSTVTNLFLNSPNPTEYGQTVNLNVTVTGSISSPPAPPTGTVQFFDNGNPIGTGTLSPALGNPNSSVATFPISTLSIGSHPITAIYGGDINYPSSTSSPKTQNVIKGSTSTVVVTSGTPSLVGQNVTFTVTVNAISPATGAPSGTVSFYDGATFLGTSSPLTPGVNSSTGTFSTSTLSLGTHYIVGIYTGDTNFTASSGPTVTQVVDISNTTTTITGSSSSPPGFNFGDFITFTADVAAIAPGAGTPTGTVNFYDGATLLGAGTLSGGIVTFTTVNLIPGNHTITAKYNGDTNFFPSTSPIFSQTINSTLPTTITVTSLYTPSASGSSVSYLVTVVANPGPGQGTPSTLPSGGAVTVYDNYYSPALQYTGTLVNGVVTITEPGIPDLELTSAIAATHPITATYAGDPYYDSSTTAAPFPQVVVPYNTTTTLVANPNYPGQPTHATQGGATLVATVTPSLATPPFPPIPPFPSSPEDTVSFYAGTTLLGTANLDPITGTATLTPTNLPFGNETIRAVFSGDDTNFATSTSNPVTLLVQQTDMIPTTTTLTSSLSSSTFCQPVTFTTTVAVTAATPPLGYYDPTGTVTFFSDGVEVGTAILTPTTTPNTSRAQLTVSSLPVGSHLMTATYNSDSNYAFSFSNVITQTVAINNTTLTLAIIPNLSPNPTPYGENVIMSATVATTSPYAAVPTGTVTFSSGTTTLGTVDIDSSGEAIFQTSTLDVGTYLITATYNPTPCFTSSAASQSYSIGQVNPMTTFTSTPNPSVYGETLLLTATVTSLVGTPTGNVTFYNGSTALGTVYLEGGSASLEITSPLAGLAVLKGTYQGDINFNAIETASVLQVIGKAPTSTCLVSFTTNPSVYGELVTLSASVSSPASDASPGLTGSVTFKNGATLLGTVPLNGCNSAVLATTNLILGSSNSIVATYSGDSNFATSASSPLTLTVIQSATTTTVTSISPNPSTFGSLVTFNVAVTALSPGSGTPTGTVTGFYGSTSLGTGTLSNGVASFSTSILPAGVQPIVVKYSGDANFTASQTAATVTVNPIGTTATLSSSVNPSVFGQPVTFSASVTSTQGVPTGTVAFLDGTTTLSTETLNSIGTASFTTASLATGSHSIKAVYSGSTNFSTSTSNTIVQGVNKDNTTTTLASSIDPSVYGDTLTLTAAVFANTPGAGIPTGTITFKNGVTTLGSGTLNNNGQVTLTLSTSLGASSLPYALTAVYSGDGNFNTSTGSLNQIINKAATLITATYTPNPANFGATVTLNVIVSPINTGSGFPSGTVTASYGSQLVGSGTLSALGTVSFQTTNLPAGTLGIVINYLGDSNFLPSALPLTGTVNQATSTTTISSSSNPSDYGQPVTFSVSVVSSAAPSVIPDGTVTFFDGLTVIGTESLDVLGQTTFTTSSLSVGTHAITAVYSGDVTNNGSVSTPTLNQVVVQAPTTTTFSSILNPSVYGETVTIAALVSATPPGAGTPTGTVTFTPGGTVTLNSNGEALLTTSLLPVGTNSITAAYNGSTNFSNSTTTASQIVAKTPTITSVTSAINPSSFGAAVPISGTVVPLNNGSATLPSAGTTVTAFYGATAVGSGTLNASGQYSFSLSNLPAGTLAIEVKYPGDTNFNPSTITLTQTVNSDSSNITLAATPNPSTYGQPVTLSSTVTLGSGHTPAGTVTYYDGSVAIGVASVGQPLVISTLSPGTHPLTAAYSGSPSASGSTSNVVNQVVNQNTPTTTLASSLNPSTYSTSVTFTATVTATSPGSGNPTGFVTFKNGSAILGTGELTPSGQAIFSTSTLPAGSNSITAVYSGDTNFSSSTSSILTQVVNKAPATATTTTIVSSIPNPSVYTQNVTFFAVVTSPVGTPTGTVTFYDGATPLSPSVSLHDGSASFSITTLTIGSHAITAVYNGDANFNPSLPSNDYIQVVNIATITATSVTTLTSSNNPSLFGESVTFTVQVSGIAQPPPYPSGYVTLFTGTIPLYTITLDSTGGGSYTTSTLPSGTLQIVAFYSGDSNFSASTTALQQVVNSIGTTTTIVSSLNPSNYGDAVTFTATASGGPSEPTPTGSFSFYEGTTLLDTVLLNNAGTANFVTSTLLAGSHIITAVYNGDQNYETSSAALNQVVNLEATSTQILTSFPNPSNVGESVAFIARTSATNGTPTGSVTFYDGGTPLGTSSLYEGLAIFSTTSLTVGGHSITAAYAGSGNYSPSASPPYIQEVIDEGTIVQSPREFCGRQVIYKNKRTCKRDRVNILKWNPPGTGAEPQYYEIYRNAELTDRIAVIPVCKSTTYKDRHRRKGKTYTYFIVAVSEGSVSPAASVTVKPLKKKHHSSGHLINKKRRDNNGGRLDKRS